MRAALSASSAAASTTRLTRPIRCASRASKRSLKQVDLERLAQSDDARQRPRAAAVGREPDLPVRGRKICVVRGDDEIARRCERQPEAGDGAVHRADHRMRHPLQVLDRRMQAVDDQLEIALAAARVRASRRVRERPQVAARHEVLPAPCSTTTRRRRVGGDVADVGDERIHHRRDRVRSARAGRLSVSVATAPSRVSRRFRIRLRGSFGHGRFAPGCVDRRVAAKRTAGFELVDRMRDVDALPRAKVGDRGRETRDRRSRAASAWPPAAGRGRACARPARRLRSARCLRSMQNSIAW